MLKSPTVLVGALGLVVAVAWFAFGGWLSGAKPPQAAAVSTLPPPPPLPAAQEPQPVVAAAQLVSVPVVQPVRIQGGLLTEVQGAPQWLYVSESGRIMTDEEIAMVSGGIVNARMDRGVRILSGPGWCGAETPRRQRHQVRWVAGSCLFPQSPPWEQRSGYRWRRLLRCLLATEPRISWPRLRGCSPRLLACWRPHQL